MSKLNPQPQVVEAVSIESRISTVYNVFCDEHDVPEELQDDLFQETIAAVAEAVVYLTDEEISALTQTDLYEAVRDYLENMLDRLTCSKVAFRRAFEMYTRPYSGSDLFDTCQTPERFRQVTSNGRSITINIF